ncbi:MAG: lipase family protein [Flavobacteriales bacterium]|nr:lipase family protein [Flavobacteriales bacterium]
MRTPLLLAVLCCPLWCNAQLRPGFDKAEYMELLRVISSDIDSMMEGYKLDAPERFQRIYRSPVVGMENRWSLYTDGKGTVAIVLRGTTPRSASWMENFYSAMVPATGTMKLDDGPAFDYSLSTDRKAAVHVGWLLGIGHLERTLLPKLDSCLAAGVRNVMICGHSQGGALGYLLTAHLWQLRASGRLPSDLVLKTYCSAAPKPGNLPFAADYEHTTRGGWAVNVVNTSDWVPETPVTVQTSDDFSAVNPFVQAKTLIRKLPFPQDVVIVGMFNKLDRPTKRARRNFKKLLGGRAGKLAAKGLPGYVPPAYVDCSDYVRTGPILVLQPDAAYRAAWPDDPARIFMHHGLQRYYELMDRYDPAGWNNGGK